MVVFMKKVLQRLFWLFHKDYFIERERLIALWVEENTKRNVEVSALPKQVEVLNKELNKYKREQVS